VRAAPRSVRTMLETTPCGASASHAARFLTDATGTHVLAKQKECGASWTRTKCMIPRHEKVRAAQRFSTQKEPAVVPVCSDRRPCLLERAPQLTALTCTMLPQVCAMRDQSG